jgi:hypothetical protein
MNPRTLAVVAGIALVVGLAAVDAFRSDQAGPRTTETTETAEATTAPTGTGPVPGLRVAGTLVYTDARDCVVHELVTGSGDEFPHPRLATDCRLTGAPVSGRIAVGVGGFGRTARFRFLDLEDVSLRLPVASGRFESIAWSPDGQLAAWCRGTRDAFELQLLGRRPRRLRTCPLGYSPSGRLLYARGRTVFAGHGRVVSAPRPVVFALWPPNGRLFLVLRGGFAQSSPGPLVAIPGGTPQVKPVVSPDGCAALVARTEQVLLVDACRPARSRAYRGTAGAWSPNGKWIAVADGAGIDFYDLRDREHAAARWNRPAAALLWR